MSNFTITSGDVEKIRRFKEISDKGFYASGQEVTDLHNKVLGTRLASTNCGSCIKTRINALVEALNKFERQVALESKKNEQMDNVPQDENKTILEAGNSPKSKAKKK